MEPLFRWAGSKRKNLPTLEGYWNDSFKRYLEPFAGSACLFFHLEPGNAVIGDLNSELIEAYETIAANPQKVHSLVTRWVNNEGTYYRIRNMQRNRLDEFERAARFMYLNRFCFNGIWRTNERGDFNVPYGGERTGSIPSLESLRKAARLLTDAKLVSCDFAELVADARPGDFFYLDPPYATAARRIFREYVPGGVCNEDMGRLREALLYLHGIGAAFVISYADCPEARILLKGFRSRRIIVRRNVAGFVNKRRCSYELIITNMEFSENETTSNN